MSLFHPDIATIITSDRLILNPLAVGDSNFILELLNTEGWLRFIGDRSVHSENDARVYIQRIIDDPEDNCWVTRLKSNNTPIGIVTFMKRDYLESHDIGCALLPLYENNGYAYEATNALLHEVIHSSTHIHISSITSPNNFKAITLVSKLGLEFRKNIQVKKEKLQVYGAHVDRIIITGITKSFFATFTNKGNTQPDLDLLNDICIPQVLMINKYRSKIDIFDLVSFIDKRGRILTDGTLMEFEEKEIFEKTKISNGIAARFSEYEKNGIIYRQRFRQKGRKLFQFVKIDKSWKISSMLWEDDESNGR